MRLDKTHYEIAKVFANEVGCTVNEIVEFSVYLLADSYMSTDVSRKEEFLQSVKTMIHRKRAEDTAEEQAAIVEASSNAKKPKKLKPSTKTSLKHNPFENLEQLTKDEE